jgi:uncharacterized protein YndB with AHSA1/START domain
MSDDTIGRARVSIESDASPDEAFAALVEQERLAKWFGAPTVPLVAGGKTRIDFGDGDFFELEEIAIDAPKQLRYSWRFLGLSAKNLITWTIARGAKGGSVITVMDDYAKRTPEGVEEMLEGWRDFTARLKGYLATGKSTRYDWRRDLDGGVEVPVPVETAVSRLFTAEGLAAWQPWPMTAPGTSIRLDDGAAPAELKLTEVDRSRPNEIRLAVAAQSWKAPTHCTIAVRERPGGTVITFSHIGWEGIGGSDEEQHRQRERFCGHWIESMKRARSLLARS